MTEHEMSNVEHVKLWIEALESGEFPQTSGRLCRRENQPLMKGGRPAGHCCLGVAVEVAIRNGIDVETQFTTTTASRLGWETEGSWSNLPSVKEFYGISKDQPRLLVGSRPDGHLSIRPEDRVEAYFANDSLGWTFQQIAEALREDYDIPKEAS